MAALLSFLGNEGTSTITAVSAVVDATSTGTTAVAGITFKTTGLEETIQNSFITGIVNWVNPTSTAAKWEIRATLDSGNTPTTGSLGVWQDFSVDRSWTIEAAINQVRNSTLTFEFRKVGDTSAEVTVTGTSLTANAKDIFDG
jgi:hypothetical protein